MTGTDYDIEIRSMTAQDLDDVSSLERSNFSTPWKREDFEDLLDKPDKGCMVAIAGNKTVGCVVYHNIVGDVDITNVQVDENFRRQGIAKELMMAAMDRARSVGGENFTLEVRASNTAAIALYKSLGFMPEGVRKNFYNHPTEDALILWKRV